jgi:hypothetical protein
MPHQFNDFAKPHIQLNAQGKVTGALHVERSIFPGAYGSTGSARISD